jgi:hypothetical protein
LKKCRICTRKSLKDSVYCSRHQLAYRNIEEAYEQWRKALNISWTHYLENIIHTIGTGDWAIEVAQDILEHS